MKLKTIKRMTVTFLVNHVFAGTRFFRCKRRMLRSIGYEIGENTKIVGPIFNTGTLRIGADCWIGRILYHHGGQRRLDRRTVHCPAGYGRCRRKRCCGVRLCDRRRAGGYIGGRCAGQGYEGVRRPCYRN